MFYRFSAVIVVLLSFAQGRVVAQDVDLWQRVPGLSGVGGPSHGGRTFHPTPDGSIFIGDGSFRSDDGGKNWNEFSRQGLPDFGITLAVGPEGELFGAGSDWVAQGTPLQLFRSTNSGATWSEIAITDPPAYDILFDFVALPSGDLLIITFNFEDPQEASRFWRSSDGGSSWSNIYTQNIVAGFWKMAVAPDGAVLASPSDSGFLVISKDNGQTWTDPPGVQSVRSFGFLDGDYFAGALDLDDFGRIEQASLLRSSDGGQSWTETGAGLPEDTFICGLTGTPDGQLYAAINGFEALGGAAKNGVYRSDDGGENFELTGPLFPELTGRDLDNTACGDIIYTSSGDLLLASRGFSRSSDSGQTWMRSDDGLTLAGDLYPRFGPDGTLFVEGGHGLFRTSDLGKTWEHTEMAVADTQGMSFGPGGLALIRSGTNTVWLSRDSGFSWAPTAPFPESPETNIFVGVVPTSTLVTPAGTLLVGTNEGIFRSTDEGASWTRILLADSFVTYMLLTPGGSILASERGERIRRSTDDGASWTNVGFPTSVAEMIVLDDGTIVAATFFDGIILSTNDGQTWTRKNSGLPGENLNWSIAVNSEGVLFTSAEVVQPGGIGQVVIFYSNDTGENWRPFEPAFPDPMAGAGDPRGIAFGPNDEFFVGGFGLFRGQENVFVNLFMPQFVSGSVDVQQGSAPLNGTIPQETVLNRTRIILINNGDSTDRGVIRFRDAEGELQAVSIGGVEKSEVPYLVGPRATLDIVTDGTGPLQSGVVEVVSELGSSSALEGTEAFDLLGKFVSVSNAPPVSTLQIYVSRVTRENTGVALYNPNAEESITVEVILYNNQGVEQARREIELDPRAQLVRFINEEELFKDYFEANPGDFTGTMTVNGLSGATFSGIGLLQDLNSFALIAVSTDSGGDPGQLLFTQFVNGEAGGQVNKTRVILINAGENADTGAVSFQDAAGAAVSVPIQGVPTESVAYNLEAGSTTELTTDGTGALQTGVIEVNSDQPESSGIAGTEVFEILGNFVSVSSSPSRVMNQAYVSVTEGEGTGVAMYNADRNESVTVTVILVDVVGKQRARKEVTLEPGERLVGFVNEEVLFKDFFDAHPDPFTGTLNIFAADGQTVAVLGLLQDGETGALIAVKTSANAFDPED